MAKSFRKLLSLLLCVTMLVSLFPAAYAAEEESATPVRMEFVCEPEETVVTVYDAQTGAAIEAEADGSYSLLPGEYRYDAFCEGYVSRAGVPFTVTEGMGPVSVVLEPVEEAESEAAEEAEAEPVEEADVEPAEEVEAETVEEAEPEPVVEAESETVEEAEPEPVEEAEPEPVEEAEPETVEEAEPEPVEEAESETVEEAEPETVEEAEPKSAEEAELEEEAEAEPAAETEAEPAVQDRVLAVTTATADPAYAGSLSEPEETPEDESDPPVVIRGGVSIAVSGRGTDDSEALLQGFFDQLVRGKSDGRKGSTAGDRLSGAEAEAYSFLAEQICLVASGQEEYASTSFPIVVGALGISQISWTISELGLEDDPIFDQNGYLTETAAAALNAALDGVFSLDSVVNALLADYPYELFWYDKTVGAFLSYYISYDGESLGVLADDDFIFFFSPAQEYAAGDYTVDWELIYSIRTAAANAQSIVAAYTSVSDRAKLLGYANEICARVEYNYAALSGALYGNPWQLIWVFDSDTNTNVVCEGYSKAFQYLCDLSTFESGSVRCLSVTGDMDDGGDAEAHMWNVVRLADGINYLVDVTNCDNGTTCDDSELFLAVPASGDLESGYVFPAFGDNILYTYSAEALSTFSDDDLTLGAVPREIIASDVFGTEGNNLTWTLYADGELVISGTGAMGNYDSSSPKPPWEYYRSSVLTLEIEDGVTNIGEYAFYNCSNLTDVSIPSSVTSIGGHAFYFCQKLTGVSIPSSVTSVGDSAFEDCAKLKTVTIAEGVESIGSRCFYYCTGLSDPITIPESVTSIGEYAFQGCSALTSVTILEGLSSIGQYAFSNCRNLTSLTLPSSLSDFGQYAFYYCDKLPSVTIPDGIASIGEYAFCACGAMTSVTIPVSVTSIGYGAFNSTALTDVYYAGTQTQWNAITIGGGNNPLLNGATVHVQPAVTDSGNCGAEGDGTNLTWTLYDTGEMVISGSGEMENYSSDSSPWYDDRSQITAVSLPEGLTSIGSYAFYNCGSLESVTIPASVTSVGNCAFQSCYSLNSVFISDLTAWCAIAFGEGWGYPFECGHDLYLNDTLIKDLVIPEGVTSIGINGFQYCAGLTSVTFSEDIMNVGDGAFSHCTALTSVTIPDSMTSIGKDVFFDCTGLTSVTIPSSVTSIGESAFEDCTSLASVTYGGTAAERAALQGSGWSTSGNDPLFDAEWTYLGTVSVTGVTINAESIEITNTETQQLTATVVPANAEDPGVVWSSSDETVATVDQTGLVTAVGLGTATITVTTNDGGFTAECVVTVVRDVIDSGTCGAQGNNVTWTLYSDGELVISGSGAMTDYTGYTRPWSSNGQNITAVTVMPGVSDISPYAFDDCPNLASIEIPSSVTSIGEHAFWNCTALTNVELSVGLVSIGDDAFCNCSSLESVTIPSTVTSIGKGIFFCCSSLSSITIPGSVPIVGRETFGYCTGLSSVTLSEGVTEIEQGAFSGCSALQSVTLPESLISIGSSAFAGCKLTEISIPASVTSIAASAFVNCEELDSFNVDSDNTVYSSIDGVLFSRNGTLVRMPMTRAGAYVIPDGVTEIGDLSFWGCSAITSVTIPESVTTIGTQAFMFSGLTGIVILAGVVSIGNYAFAGSAITNVVFSEGVTSLTESAFAGCASLESITIPSSVTSIDKYAFLSCNRLTSVTIPSSVTSIGESAFEDCTSLASVTYGGTAAGRAALQGSGWSTSGNDPLFDAEWTYLGTVSVTGVTIDAESIEITDTETQQLTVTVAPADAEDPSVVWSSSDETVATVDQTGLVTAVGLGTATITVTTNDGGFTAECVVTVVRGVIDSGICGAQGDNLTWTLYDDGELVVSGTGAMADYTYAGPWKEYRKQILNVEIARGVTSIGDWAFWDCSSLTGITIPGTMTSIGTGAFEDCGSLTSVLIPNSVTSIGDSAFCECYSLASVTISDNVTSIGAWAF